jgi:hypothetical protein
MHPRSLIRIHAVRLQTLLQVVKLIANSMVPNKTARMHYAGFVVTRLKCFSLTHFQFLLTKYEKHILNKL